MSKQQQLGLVQLRKVPEGSQKGVGEGIWGVDGGMGDVLVQLRLEGTQG